MPATNGAAQFTSYLIPKRECLLLTGDGSTLAQELELHALSCALDYEPLVLQMLKDGLNALALQVLTRPADEMVGWTVSIQKPTMNLFFTGNPSEGCVVGRAFLDGVQEREENLFIVQIKNSPGKEHLSSVMVDGLDIYAMVEEYYARSEQKTARFFHDGDRIAFVQALEGADEPWLRSLDARQAFGLVDSDAGDMLCRRAALFHCGCNDERILTVVSRVYGDDFQQLFGGDPEVIVECPRCAAEYYLVRSRYEEYVQGRRRN